MDMPISDLVEMARSIRQSYEAKAERNPVQVIGQDAANAFNRLLDESKKKYPEHPLIRKMNPANPSRTQLAGLLAKVGLLEDCLKTEHSRLLRLLAKSK
jgi:ABC-type dipeptide/oligopeptide/nickel transport system ATPase subunit